MFIGLFGFLDSVGFIDSLKELSQLFHYFLQLAMRWLARLGGCEDTEFISKLESVIVQSSNDFVGFFPKDWDMPVILIFRVTSFIVSDGGGSLVVFIT
jgi:hypothetical protein